MRVASGSVGFANISVRTREVPFGGVCSLRAASNTSRAGSLLYELTCARWHLPVKSEGPLRYSAYCVFNGDRASTLQLGMGSSFDNLFNVSVPLECTHMLVVVADAAGSEAKVTLRLNDTVFGAELVDNSKKNPIDALATAQLLRDQEQIGFALTNLLVALSSSSNTSSSDAISSNSIVDSLLNWIGPSPPLASAETRLRLLLRVPVSDISLSSTRALFQWMYTSLSGGEIYSESLFRLFLELIDRYLLAAGGTKDKTQLMESCYLLLTSRAITSGESTCSALQITQKGVPGFDSFLMRVVIRYGTHIECCFVKAHLYAFAHVSGFFCNYYYYCLFFQSLL